MQLDENTRYQLLRVLADHPEYTQRELASAMGLSLGKTNYCLHALITKGLVKVENFQSKQNKRVYAYLLTPQGLEEKVRVTIRFLQRKQDEYDALKAEIEALREEALMLQPKLAWLDWNTP